MLIEVSVTVKDVKRLNKALHPLASPLQSQYLAPFLKIQTSTSQYLSPIDPRIRQYTEVQLVLQSRFLLRFLARSDDHFFTFAAIVALDPKV